MLPGRSREEEDAFVAQWSESADTEALAEAIDHAMAERRPMLAARLVQLLEGSEVVGDHPGLAQAQRAARFLLHSAREERGVWNVQEGAFEDLEAAWTAVRRGRMDRIRARQRDALAGKATRIPRVGRRRGKR